MQARRAYTSAKATGYPFTVLDREVCPRQGAGVQKEDLVVVASDLRPEEAAMAAMLRELLDQIRDARCRTAIRRLEVPGPEERL